MGTTPRGIIFPASTGNTNLWTHIENLATSADDAISYTVGRKVSVANFAALSGIPAPNEGLQIWLLDIKAMATYDGTAWKVTQSAAGYVNLVWVGGVESAPQVISFGKTFKSAPVVVGSYAEGNTTRKPTVICDQETTTQFRIYAYNESTSTATRRFAWHAILP